MHIKSLIKELKERWDVWDAADGEKDDQISFNSFYNGFMGGYFGCFRCEDTRKGMLFNEITFWFYSGISLRRTYHNVDTLYQADKDFAPIL